MEMIDIKKMMELFIKKFEDEFGKNAKIEYGDKIAIVMKNCVGIIKIDETENLSLSLTPNVVYINNELDVYCKSEDCE